MLNCRETTQLVSESQDRPLNLKEKLQLRLHLWMCVGCRNFQRSVHLLRDAMQGFASGVYEPEKGTDGKDLDSEGEDTRE